MRSVAVFCCLWLAGCAAAPSAGLLPTQTIILEGATQQRMTVEVARTPLEQERGLMDRQELPPGIGGMLFIFPDAHVRSFWMKDTLIPLDIFFFDASGTLVSQHRMEPCRRDPCVTYSSGYPAQYALEVPAGSMAAGREGSGWSLRMP